MKNKAVRDVLAVVVAILAIPVLYLLVPTVFYFITHPTISLKELNKPIIYEVVSAKQIETYLSSEIQKNDKLNKYDLIIGSINMIVDREHQGEVTVIFVEKDNKRSKVIYAYLDTHKGIFYKFQDAGRESKLYPGIIHLRDWKIDSIDAVRISEEFFSSNKDFRYDEILIITTSIYDSNEEESWNIHLTDIKNKIRYVTSINPYSGEVVYHTIYHFPVF